MGIMTSDNKIANNALTGGGIVFALIPTIAANMPEIRINGSNRSAINCVIVSAATTTVDYPTTSGIRSTMVKVKSMIFCTSQ